MTITTKELAERVKRLRTGNDFSQEEVAKQLGLSRQSIGQIESAERGISGLELAAFAEFFGISIEELVAVESKDIQKISRKINGKSKVFSVKFDPDKLRNLLLYVLARCGGKPNVGETVLYKLLYFIDFDSFELYGKAITGLSYKKMQFGPVPDTNQYNPIIMKMTKAGELKIVRQLYGDMHQKKYVAFADPTPDSFSATELQLIDGVIDRLSDMNGRKIADYVHHDVPWMAVGMYEPIEYHLVFDRTAPFARTDKDWQWQEAGGHDTIKHLGPISKAEHDYYMNLK